jgi:Domain of unknown function (DUF4429)
MAIVAVVIALAIELQLCAKEYRLREVTREFQREHPCPSTGKSSGACRGYPRDHIVPLTCGGLDDVSNMQWCPSPRRKRTRGNSGRVRLMGNGVEINGAPSIRGRLAMIEASGMNGRLRIDGEALIIDHKRGLLTVIGMGIQGERRILLRNITSVQLAKANIITNGYIRFTFHGGSDRPYGITEAGSDPNCVIFAWSANRQFESFKIAIEKAISAERERNSNLSRGSIADEIEKLLRLRDRGIISEQEFQDQKSRLLAA